jgi:hypothetical protein
MAVAVLSLAVMLGADDRLPLTVGAFQAARLSRFLAGVRLLPGRAAGFAGWAFAPRAVRAAGSPFAAVAARPACLVARVFMVGGAGVTTGPSAATISFAVAVRSVAVPFAAVGRVFVGERRTTAVVAPTRLGQSARCRDRYGCQHHSDARQSGNC